MAIFLWKHKLSYFPVPKVACTSIKMMFFQIENGFDFVRFRANGLVKHIHNVAYDSAEFSKIEHGMITDHTRLAVVRDPIERLLSCYGNRVIHYKDLAAESVRSQLIANNVSHHPRLDEFIDHIEIYRKVSLSIRHHTNPIVNFLGRDITYYDKLYKFCELSTFEHDVRSITQTEVALKKYQSDGPKFTQDCLSNDHVDKVESLYVDDYRVFGSYFVA